ncbi:MAG: RagB/SusD family protein [Mucilaginibacter sp.]|nr:RagB/SusD family protein [Mucilaginibacter sp.]
MYSKVYYISCVLLIFVAFVLGSCQKDFLKSKPNKALLVPETLADFQALLDNSSSVMNIVPYLNEVGTDDIYTTQDGLTSQSQEIQNAYIWSPTIFQERTSADWNIPYQQVLYANIVLDGLTDFKTTPSTQSQLNQIRGSALFFRAFAFYNIAQQFATPYSQSSADQALGIPIRLTSSVNVVSKRGTLQQTYDQIINDLVKAVDLLPPTQYYKTRPTKAAALAMVARVFQTMENYKMAAQYAALSLSSYNKLIDYNSLTDTAAMPLPSSLPNGNDEVVFYAALIYNGFISGSSPLTSVDSLLYQSYANNDLRKTVFFNKVSNDFILFKGSYAVNGYEFGGLSTDEVYLISAECNARNGNTVAAMTDLNTLLKTRWKTGTFIPYVASNPDDALTQILKERRKELIYRNIRWTDLRRLNKDPRFAVTLKRNINGQIYTLPPNDKRYVFPIPDDVIAASGIQQNPR